MVRESNERSMLVMDIGTFINNTSKFLNIGGFKGTPLLEDPSLHFVCIFVNIFEDKGKYNTIQQSISISSHDHNRYQ